MFGTLLTVGWYMCASYALCNSDYHIAARKFIQTETEELRCPHFVFICHCSKGWWCPCNVCVCVCRCCHMYSFYRGFVRAVRYALHIFLQNLDMLCIVARIKGRISFSCIDGKVARTKNKWPQISIAICSFVVICTNVAGRTWVSLHRTE